MRWDFGSSGGTVNNFRRGKVSESGRRCSGDAIALHSKLCSRALLIKLSPEPFPLFRLGRQLCRGRRMVNSLMMLAVEANGAVALRMMKLMRGAEAPVAKLN
jgi:hypothetical protein